MFKEELESVRKAYDILQSLLPIEEHPSTQSIYNELDRYV
jgi:hypothetical protein